MSKIFKKILTSPWTALLTLALCAGARIADPAFVESVRLRYFDTLITGTEVKVSEQVHLVNIDDAAIEKLGQFPFPRGQYANIIQDLYQRNAGLVVFNIFMPDADRAGQDAVLASALKQMPTVLPHTATNDDVRSSVPPFRPGVSVIGSGEPGIPYRHIQPNVRSINETASGIGIVNTLPEVDGVVRRIPMVANIGGQLYPSISLETLRVASGDPSFQVRVNDGIIEAVRIPQFGKIPTDNLGRIWVDWSSRPTQHSLANLPKDFQGGIVIVGLTARGLNNPVATAGGEVYPHFVQAAVIDTVVSGRMIQRPDYADGAEIIVLIAGGLLLLFLTRWTYVGLGAVVVLVGGSVVASWYSYHGFLWLFDATAFAGGTILVALHAYGVKFVSEFLQKQAIKKQFAGYCSKEVVEMLQKDPDLIKRGVRKDVSVMFSDLRGFTPIGEHYGDDVGGLGKYMNGYMDSISRPIMDNRGMVIKYVGDASMHIHGAPIEDPNHARTIVKVGLEMLDAVDEYTKLMEAQGLPPAAMGWGCNTGIGFIGEMGSTQRHSYDILGDMVSTAARLEARCKAYGVLCIIGAETYNRTRDDFFYLMLDNLQPKGKTVADLIYTALRIKGDVKEYYRARETHNKMHALYRERQFDAAAILCGELAGSFDGQMDKYYHMWTERCEFMKQQDLPDNWNGEFVAHEK
jgi:adenylate cyclase